MLSITNNQPNAGSLAIVLCSAAISTGFWFSMQFCELEHGAAGVKIRVGTPDSGADDPQLSSSPACSGKLKSPDGLYAIKCINQPPQTGNSQALENSCAFTHDLILERSGQTNESVFYTISRFAEIDWSPDSSEFILNDWAGSDIAIPYIYRVRDVKHPINVFERLSTALTLPSDKMCFTNCVHIYMTARWVNERVIEIKTTGDYTTLPSYKGEYREFTLYYLWDLRNDALTRTKRLEVRDDV